MAFLFCAVLLTASQSAIRINNTVYIFIGSFEGTELSCFLDAYLQILVALTRVMLYSLFLLRLHLTFNGSALQYSPRTLVPLGVFILISTALAVSFWIYDIVRQIEAADGRCTVNDIDYTIVRAVGIAVDSVLYFVLIALFLRKLAELVLRETRGHTEESHKFNPNASRGSMDSGALERAKVLIQSMTKLTVLACVSVSCSWIIAASFTWSYPWIVDMLDVIQRTFCILWCFEFHSKQYGRYCFVCRHCCYDVCFWWFISSEDDFEGNCCERYLCICCQSYDDQELCLELNSEVTEEYDSQFPETEAATGPEGDGSGDRSGDTPANTQANANGSGTGDDRTLRTDDSNAKEQNTEQILAIVVDQMDDDGCPRSNSCPRSNTPDPEKPRLLHHVKSRSLNTMLPNHEVPKTPSDLSITLQTPEISEDRVPKAVSSPTPGMNPVMKTMSTLSSPNVHRTDRRRQPKRVWNNRVRRLKRLHHSLYKDEGIEENNILFEIGKIAQSVNLAMKSTMVFTPSDETRRDHESPLDTLPDPRSHDPGLVHLSTRSQSMDNVIEGMPKSSEDTTDFENGDNKMSPVREDASSKPLPVPLPQTIISTCSVP